MDAVCIGTAKKTKEGNTICNGQQSQNKQMKAMATASLKRHRDKMEKPAINPRVQSV